MSDSNSITVLLAAWHEGNLDAREVVFERLYQRLHEIAKSMLRAQGEGHTVAPTVLVHEAFLRFLGEGQLSWNDRNHFLSTAAQVMRRFLIDHIRKQQADKRGGDGIRAEWKEELPVAITAQPEQLLALHLALESLEQLDERAARVVEMKFFGGLTEEEIAGVLSLSAVSVRRDWAFARAFLIEHLGRPQ